MCILSSKFDLSSLQIFSSTDEEELLRGASQYAIYFVILAIGAGSVQFIGVSLFMLIGKSLLAAHLASRHGSDLQQTDFMHVKSYSLPFIQH